MEEARTLISTLRLASDASVARFGMVRGRYADQIGLKGAFLGLSFAMVITMMGCIGLGERMDTMLVLQSIQCTPLFLLLALRWAQTVTIRVGADGLQISSALARNSFVAFSDIIAIDMRRNELRLKLTSGDVTFSDEFRCFGRPRGEAAELLAARLQERLEARSAACGTVASLARGRRTTADWLGDVVALVDGHASYRRSALPPTEELLRIVEDGGVTASARVAAACALAFREEPEARRRIRAAAEACAAPSLREALDSAAKDAVKPADLLGVLEQVDDDLSSRVARA